MKTKRVTKNRKAERDMDVALLECEEEFGNVLNEDFLDEVYVEDDEE